MRGYGSPFRVRASAFDWELSLHSSHGWVWILYMRILFSAHAVTTSRPEIEFYLRDVWSKRQDKCRVEDNHKHGLSCHSPSRP